MLGFILLLIGGVKNRRAHVRCRRGFVRNSADETTFGFNRGKFNAESALYKMNRVLTALHGGERLVHIKGLDELRLHLKDTSTEFCNMSFQVHLQKRFRQIS